FGAVCETFTTSRSFLGDSDPSFNDTISSAKVQAQGATCQPSTTPPQGFSQISVFNCDSEMRAVHLWTRDLTAGASFVEKGTLASQFSNGSCPGGASPFLISLTDGHQFDFVAVDPGALACGGNNDPQQSACVRLRVTQPVPGLSSGPSLNETVD
ncbi:MAG: hypothetical protein WA633_28675, partial [Stellaceae bacterium]